jgi:hypothetical protein
MSLLERKTQVAVEIEAEEGTAETLVAADAVLHMNPTFKPDTPMNERPVASSTMSLFASIPGKRSMVMEWDSEIKGAGAAGTAPELSDALQACGMDETIVASTSVTYTPLSSAVPSATVGMYMDGLLALMWGARGNVAFSMTAGGLCIAHFRFVGADFSITDVAMLSGVTYQSTKPQPFLGATFSIAGYAAKIASLGFDLGNEIMLREDPSKSSGHASAVITSRAPKLTLDPEMVAVGTEDFFGDLRAGNEGALSLVLGATAGNITTITAPKVQYTNLSPASRTGLRSLGIDCQLNRSSGDDEISIAFT